MTESSSERIIARNCEVTMIPSGQKVTLPEGTPVTITHRLGGNFTVSCEYGLFRIDGKDAEVIGESIPEPDASPKKHADHSGPPDQEKIWDALKSVFDPEIPVNIVDLGLVYSMDVSETSPDTFTVDVKMTLTAPGCGMGPVLAEDARAKLLDIPGVSEANVEIVWDPPWSQDMLSEAAKMELGFI